MTCPACGAPVAEGARFCSECGQRLVATPDERRLVTVLMADLVGFTAMSAVADPEQIKRLVDHCFERLIADVTAFGGQLDKIVGDEIIAFFGAPVAHEDDAERAVRAALRMHETLAGLVPELGVPVTMRVGVNTGEVLVGAMRAGGDPTVMGDVVNTAQRLQTMAEPGSVIVGAATHTATRSVIRYEPLGLVALRGREEPVEAYRAVEAVAPPGRRRVRERVPLVGRDDELAALRHVLHMTASRERAHLVLLVGDAGVGKSRLASEVAAIAAGEVNARVLVGQCVPYGDSNVFGPVAEALRHACGIEGLAREGAARARVIETVTAMLGLTAEASETERIVEGLLYLMEGVTRPGVDPGRARDDALRSALAFFEALARREPLVLVLSDLHWADDEVLELCDRLLARLRNLPLSLVATARPGFEERWTPQPGRHNTLGLHLDPLDDTATAELVRSLFCGEVDDETVAFLLDRSGGNPFFVEELVAFVQESRDGRIQELPATLHGLVAARLDALDAAERSLLEDCAVVGASGPIAPVVAMAARIDARHVLDRLAERDLLQVIGDDYHFKSELIREIAYGTLTKAERARRHAALAPILAARGEVAVDQVAHHLASAAELVGEIGSAPGVPADVRAQAVEALTRAAERDEAVESWLQSGRHFDRALALLTADDGPARRRALLGRARAAVAQRELDDARDAAFAALDDARANDDRPSEASALTLLGEAEAAAGSYDAAEEMFTQALTMWRELRDESGVAHVLRELGMAHLFRGELIEAERSVSEALAAFRSSGNRRGEAWAQQNLAWIAFTHGDIPAAETRLQQSADLFGELGDWGGLGWAYGLLAFVRYNQGRLDEAAAIAEHISEEGRETGNRWAVGMMDVLLSNVALWRGRTRESLDRGRNALELFQEIGDNWGEVMSTGPVVRALAELGRDDEYQGCIARLHEVARAMPDEGMHDFGHVLEACIDLQRGDVDRASRILEHLDVDESGIGGADFYSARGLAYAQQGRLDDAIALLEAHYPGAEHDGPAMALGSRLALAYAAAGRVDDAQRVIDELQARSGGTYSDRILALWAESLAHARRGDRDARAPIDAAHAIATTTDAPLEHALAALARAKVLTALAAPDASEVADDAHRQLDAMGISALGWHHLFDLALADVLPVA
jgi:class 3 adenylate cyclase/tetratricopeptide (TPR) repeat protein